MKRFSNTVATFAGIVALSTALLAGLGRASETTGQGAQRSNSQGTVAGIQGSGGAGAVKWENKYGNGATVAKDKDGDVYVGKDGNVYKRDEGGAWSMRQKWRVATAAQRSDDTAVDDDIRYHASPATDDDATTERHANQEP